MAGFVAGRREFGLKKTSSSCTVPDHPRARLMYYLNCVSTVLALEDAGIGHLTNYNNYRSLDRGDVSALIRLCLMFSPDKLLNKVFFLVDDCGASSNAFYEISQVDHMLAVTSSVVIGGRTREAVEVMLLERSWLQRNYFQPLRDIDNSTSKSCTIL